ncbi:hypothetical protein FQR65_LT07980 [Abscondita terminalis]|nr:hypothetical protein FQR65_LT07980 [Abscondita terminalis]
MKVVSVCIKLNCTMLVLPLLSLILTHCVIGRSVDNIKQLTPEEIERIKNWTEDDQNIWQLSGQFEGDIILNDDQRNGLINQYYRWPNKVIPYMFDASVTASQRQSVTSALNDYVTLTCIRPTLITAPVTDYVLVTNNQNGCFSSVGRQGGRQILNLQSGTSCFSKGTVLHEFLHALGFFHQQSATERDDYVTIVKENVIPDKLHNFNKYDANTITNFGVKYDYGSVMHYDAYAFSIGAGKKTIITKDPNAVIGQRAGLSAADIQKLKKMYNCP